MTATEPGAVATGCYAQRIKKHSKKYIGCRHPVATAPGSVFEWRQPTELFFRFANWTLPNVLLSRICVSTRGGEDRSRLGSNTTKRGAVIAWRSGHFFRCHLG